MRNISRSLWPASFRGIPFEVETEAYEEGRRLIVHEFPKGDTPLIEDMGRKARTFPIRAFIPNTLLAARDIFLSACRSEGAGLLILPLQGPLMVRVQDVSVSHESNRLGYLALSITFVEEPGYDFLSVRSLFGTLAGYLELGGALIGNALATALHLTGIADLVAAIDALMAFPASLEAAFGGILRAAALTETGRGEAKAAVALLDGLLWAGAPETQADAIAATVVDRMTDAGTILRRGLRRIDGATAVTALAALLDTEPDGEEPRGKTGRRRRDNHRAVQTALAALSAVALARVVAASDYGDRSTAVTARDRLRDQIGPIATTAGSVLGADAGALVFDALGTAARVLDRRMTTLAPVVGVQTTVSLPSTVLAWTLYQDPSRGQELAERNGIGTPCLMPMSFEALVS